MKVKAIDLFSRVITVSDYITSYYVVNPTRLRYERCKKILVKLNKVNEELPDNEYRHDNWTMLMTASTILCNLHTLIYESQSEKLNEPAFKNRKTTIICSSSCYKRLRPAK